MSKFIRIAALLLLASCGGNNTAPRNLDDACSIVAQRPAYLRAMKRTERRWGVPVNVQMATIYQESKFLGHARTPFRYALGIIPMGRQSSAYGYSQAIDSTWEDYRRANRRFGAKRNRIEDATDFMGWYMDSTEKKLGIPKYDATAHYLAYHEGHSGYARGSYNEKAWLMRVAAEVGQRSETYRVQLARCGKL